MLNETAGVKTNDEGSVIEAGVETKTEVSSAPAKEGEPDYKALYEKEVEITENLKTALTQKRQLVKGKADGKEGDDEGDKPATINDVRKVVNDAVVPNKVDTILNEKVKDPAKRTYVKFLYDERIRQTGDSDEAISNDISEAIDLAESKANKKKVSELTRVTQQQKTTATAGSSSDTTVATPTHKFSTEQVKDLTARAKAINADPEKFIAKAWENQSGR